ncbi:radical SAM protein [bacterium]|nr:radical SAM protein [bacterium]
MSELSPVYGPVHSWRFGNSLGIDMIVQRSTCSFNCVYCQLGHIQDITGDQRIFVPTSEIIAALERVDWTQVDVATFSGSGEPTLALNIHEVIHAIRSRWNKPVMILTNSTLLGDPATRQRLYEATTIACKLDAADDETLRKVNRPAPGITVDSIIDGIAAIRSDGYTGTLALQCMFLPTNRAEAERIAELAARIQPDEIHLNTPRRPYPRQWYPEARGNHNPNAPVPTIQLKTITLEEAVAIERIIQAAVPRAKVLSVYRDAPAA